MRNEAPRARVGGVMDVDAISFAEIDVINDRYLGKSRLSKTSFNF